MPLRRRTREQSFRSRRPPACSRPTRSPAISVGPKVDIWLTATIEGEPTGFGFCEPERMIVGPSNLLAIGVLPDQQSQGVGAQLIRHLDTMLGKLGRHVLLVETIYAPEFVWTKAFYLSHGFVEEARVREFYEAGADNVVSWKHL